MYIYVIYHTPTTPQGGGGCGTLYYVYICVINRHLAQATAAKRWRASSGLAHCAWSVFSYPSFPICWHMLWARGVSPA